MCPPDRWVIGMNNVRRNAVLSCPRVSCAPRHRVSSLLVARTIGIMKEMHGSLGPVVRLPGPGTRWVEVTV